MTNGEILERAVKKAVNNGYKLHSTNHLTKKSWGIIAYKDYEIFIFSINFAKSFFGFEKVPLRFVGGNFNIIRDEKEGIDFEYSWKFHLQQMVILDDTSRIKYLEKFL